MTPILRIVAACALTVLAAGCSNSAPEAPPAPSNLPPPTGPAITISALNYGDPLTVAPGTQVAVINKDDVAHTVTSKAKGQFDARVAPHSWVTFSAPTDPGQYPFYCIYHPAMMGTLIVQ